MLKILLFPTLKKFCRIVSDNKLARVVGYYRLSIEIPKPLRALTMLSSGSSFVHKIERQKYIQSNEKPFKCYF